MTSREVLEEYVSHVLTERKKYVTENMWENLNERQAYVNVVLMLKLRKLITDYNLLECSATYPDTFAVGNYGDAAGLRTRLDTHMNDLMLYILEPSTFGKLCVQLIEYLTNLLVRVEDTQDGQTQEE